jgi:hypothetical protein
MMAFLEVHKNGVAYWVEVNRHFTLILCSLLGLLFETEHGGSPFLRNVGELIPECAASHNSRVCAPRVCTVPE